MRIALSIYSVFILFLGAGCMIPLKNKTVLSPGAHPMKFEKTITKKVSCQYLLVLPHGYDKQGEPWPLILFLHGAGERGNNLEIVKRHGPIYAAERQKNFPFVLLCPQCPDEQIWSSDVLVSLLDDIVSQYNVDPKRVYLTGLSMGGFGTWELACTYPEHFAAIAPVCGGGMSLIAKSLKNVPVWAFHGAKDNLVPLRMSEEMVNAVNVAGGNAKLTVYPDLGHDSWTVTYENKELYDWFLSHIKK